MATKDPEKLKAKRKRRDENRKLKMKNDPVYAEHIRALDRAKKKRRRENNKEGINEYQRNFYGRDREANAAKQLAARRKREPTRGLAKLDQLFRRGEISARDYINQYRAAIEQCSTLIDRRGGDNVPRESASGADKPSEG